MKKEVILNGMGWGHMPDFLIEQECRGGRLVSIEGKHMRGSRLEIKAVRRRDVAHGPIAHKLWAYIEQCAPRWHQA